MDLASPSISHMWPYLCRLSAKNLVTSYLLVAWVIPEFQATFEVLDLSFLLYLSEVGSKVD